MGHAGGVGGLEAVAGVDELAQDLAAAHRARQPGGIAQPAGQRLATDELHGDEQPAVVGAGLVDLDDVGVGDLGQGLGLAQQPLVGLGGQGRAAANQLERHLAVKLLVVGGVDLAHGAGAERLEQDEPADPDRVGLAKQRGADGGLAQVGRDRRLGPRREHRLAGDRLVPAGRLVPGGRWRSRPRWIAAGLGLGARGGRCREISVVGVHVARGRSGWSRAPLVRRVGTSQAPSVP
ncbi:MAG TPA: hypothetical protein VGD37_14920 [Kofleriaceae bacterium]